jgi:dynein light intermediate chain 1
MALPPFNNPTPEQAFLGKNYDENAQWVDCDPCGTFRCAIDPSAPPAAGLVGPLCSSTFSLPAVERELAEMERGGSRCAGSARSPMGQTQHKVLHNFFKSLLNTKDRMLRVDNA